MTCGLPGCGFDHFHNTTPAKDNTMDNQEQTHTPSITGVNGHVLISLPNDQYIRMPADTARKFGTRIIAAAAKSEGKSGYEFLIEVND